MPKNQEQKNAERIQFVREGETLTKENFAELASRYSSEMRAKPRGQLPNETRLHYVQNVMEPATANKLRADAFMENAMQLLTPEQKEYVLKNASTKQNEALRNSIRMNTREVLSAMSSEKVALKEKLPDGPEKVALNNEINAFTAATRKLELGKPSIEEIKEIARPFLTEEQMNGPLFQPISYVTGMFLSSDREHFFKLLQDTLTLDQMQQLQKATEEYVLPWDRTHEEMGVKVYTEQSEKAKADIDAMPDLSQEQKDAMKADIDAANDFLREPKGEEPTSAYFQLSTEYYEKAVLSDGEVAGRKQLTEEGYDINSFEDVINMNTFTSDPVVKNQEEFNKLNNAEFKMSPETKTAIKHVYSLMQKYGYCGKGVVGEQDVKEYGLTMLAATIDNYKKAIASGDATRIAEASKAMVTEKEHVDEMVAFVRENFPVDRHSENFAKAGNVDVVRNKTFPPDYRYDEAITAFNSIYIMANFAEANGIPFDEFLESPAKFGKEYFLETVNQGLNKSLNGKTGGDALFEASRDWNRVHSKGGLGAPRAFEALNFLDKDPAIRAHNHGLGSFMQTAVMISGDAMEIQRRQIAYTKGHLDRFLFVSEPRDNASLLGVPIYNVHTLSYDQPEAFNEAEYLLNNGKSLSEMKEQMDSAYRRFLYLAETDRTPDKLGQMQRQSALNSQQFIELIQSAASKILMSRINEKDDPAYQALKEAATDGKKYVDNLLKAERDKTRAAEEQLKEAEKQGNQPEIERLKAFIESNKAFDNLDFSDAKPQTKYADFIKKYEDLLSAKTHEGVNVKPDEEFNKSISDINKEIAGINSRISDRTVEIGAAKVADDNEIQVLNAARIIQLAQIDSKKKEYIEQLEQDVKDGRISEHFKQERIKQLNDKNYKYDVLPDFFPDPANMTKEEQAARQKDAEKFLLGQNGELFGFVDTKPEVKSEKQVEKQVEKEADFTGVWFEPGSEVTRADLIGKVTALENRLKTEINGENWLESHKEQEVRTHEIDRLEVFFNEGLNTISDEDKQKLFDLMGEEAKEKATSSAIYRYYTLLTANGKSEESKAVGKQIFENRQNLTLKEAQELAEKYLTSKDKADPRIKPFNHISFEQIRNTTDGWKTFINGIPEDKLKSVALKADAKQTAMERMTFEEAKIPRYTNEISSVKSLVDNLNAFNGQVMTSERKAEINALLDEMLDITSNLNDEYSKEIGSIRMSREEGDSFSMNRTRSKIAHDVLQNEGIDTRIDGGVLVLKGLGSKEAVYEKGIPSIARVKTLTDEARQQAHDLNGRGFIFREETKQAVKSFFERFDEYGYDKAPFVPEQDFKVYSLHRYTAALEEFKKHIKSDDVVEQIKVVDDAAKVKVEYDRVKTLAKEAGDLFGVNEGGFYPGNLDCERNAALPPEFRRDIGGISALNGLYFLYRTLKERNVGVDEFLADPRPYVEKMVREGIDRLDLNKTIRGKTGADAMFEALRTSSGLDPTGNYGFNRTVETVAKMEKDPALRAHNIASEFAFSLSTGLAYTMTEQRDTTQEVTQRHLDRFLMVKEPMEDASLTGAPTVNFVDLDDIPPKEFNDVEYLMNSHEDVKSFTDRVIEEGCKFIAMNANDAAKRKGSELDGIPIERGFDAMQQAAIKFITVRQDVNKKDPSYRTLKELAERGPEFIIEQINKMKDEGKIELITDEDKYYDAYSKIIEASPDNLRVSQSLDDFKKSAEVKNLGDAVRDADKTANRQLMNLQADVERAQKLVDRNGGEAEKQQLKEAQERLNEAVAKRKEELMEDFRKGKIPEYYLNKRNEQLDNGKFNENLPKMFEADQLKSKNEYLNGYAKQKGISDEDFNDLSKEEKNELYQRYVENAKLEKEQFIMQKYLEKEKRLPALDKKTVAERIAAEDKRLAMMEKAYGDKTKNVQKEKEVEQIVIDETEPEVKAEKNAQEKAEEKVEVKEEEKALGDDGVERVSIDLDDEPVELNDDILNLGGSEKKLNKDVPNQ